MPCADDGRSRATAVAGYANRLEADELRALGVQVDEAVIPSIRSIVKVE